MSIKIGIGIKIAGQSTAPPEPSFEPETEVLLARAAVAPSEALAELINTTIKGLKDDGVFALGDCLYVRGVHEETLACQNWIKNDHNSTPNGAPVFTQKVGYTGNGAGAYLDNDYIPSTDAVQMSISHATVAVLMQTQATNVCYILGAFRSLSAWRTSIWFSNAANERGYIQTNSYNGNTSVADGQMLSYIKSLLTMQGYINGVASGALRVGIVDDSALVDLSVYELCYNINGGAANYNNGTIMFSFYGNELTPTQMLALYNRIAYFYANVGGTF